MTKMAAFGLQRGVGALPRGVAASDAMVDAINDDGRTYLTQTVLDGRKVIRFQAGQFETAEGDLDIAFDAILDCARQLARAGAA